MSQLARREIAPHRAAFVTSLSRWYIRRLLGNLPPFHPCLSAERRPRIVPYGTSPHYGHTPRKSRHSKPFLPSYQCIRNWSGLSAAECPITGTGRAHRVERPELSGSVPPGIRWPNQLSLWRCWPLERRVRRAARGWNTRNMGRAFLSAPKPRWRSGPVRFTGLLERRAESMDE